MRHINVVYEPVIEGAVILKLQCADRMSYTFYCVFITMSKIIHRIDAPVVFRPVVASLQYPVYDRISHVEVVAGHVYLGPKHS